jgi:hypothetical protein
MRLNVGMRFSEADAAVVVWKDRDPDVRRVLARVERKGMPVHVIGAPQKKPRAVRRKSEPEPPRREGDVTGLKRTAPAGPLRTGAELRVTLTRYPFQRYQQGEPDSGVTAPELPRAAF